MGDEGVLRKGGVRMGPHGAWGRRRQQGERPVSAFEAQRSQKNNSQQPAARGDQGNHDDGGRRAPLVKGRIGRAGRVDGGTSSHLGFVFVFWPGAREAMAAARSKLDAISRGDSRAGLFLLACYPQGEI